MCIRDSHYTVIAPTASRPQFEPHTSFYGVQDYGDQKIVFEIKTKATVKNKYHTWTEIMDRSTYLTIDELISSKSKKELSELAVQRARDIFHRSGQATNQTFGEIKKIPLSSLRRPQETNRMADLRKNLITKPFHTALNTMAARRYAKQERADKKASSRKKFRK